MRKWKDDGSHVIKPLQRKLYFIIGCLIIVKSFTPFILYRTYDFIDVFQLGCGLLLIWGVNLNGFYKFARIYTEWKLKSKDNKFDYYSK